MDCFFNGEKFLNINDTIISFILDIAKNDARIRAVLLNGSRANPNAVADEFQDYDLMFIVKEMETFLSNHNWVDVFGDRVIMQLPDTMNDGKNSISFAYLMQLKSGDRIDLTLFPIEKISNELKPESLTKVLLDKDNLFINLPESNDSDFIIQKPNQKEFSDCCNEFWWVSTYVAKGLVRGEITYAMEHLNKPVRDMFMKMIEWYIGVKNNSNVSFGKSGRNIKKYVDENLWKRIMLTYPDSNPENIRQALLNMIEIFRELAINVSKNSDFEYNYTEDKNVTKYLSKLLTKL